MFDTANDNLDWLASRDLGEQVAVARAWMEREPPVWCDLPAPTPNEFAVMRKNATTARVMLTSANVTYNPRAENYLIMDGEAGHGYIEWYEDRCKAVGKKVSHE